MSTLYLSNFQISGLSHFIFFKEKIYEEIRIFKPSDNHTYFDSEKIFLFKLYRILEHPMEVPFYEFKNYQIEIIPRYKRFFWYKDYEQKYSEIPSAKLNNINY